MLMIESSVLHYYSIARRRLIKTFWPFITSSYEESFIISWCKIQNWKKIQISWENGFISLLWFLLRCNIIIICYIYDTSCLRQQKNGMWVCVRDQPRTDIYIEKYKYTRILYEVCCTCRWAIHRYFNEQIKTWRRIFNAELGQTCIILRADRYTYAYLCRLSLHFLWLNKWKQK